MTAARSFKDMPVYDPTEKVEPQASIGLRIPMSLLTELDACVRLLKMFARARGEETKQLDRSSVIRRFIRIGRDQLFAEFGAVPQSEEDWAKLDANIQKVVKKTSR